MQELDFSILSDTLLFLFGKKELLSRTEEETKRPSICIVLLTFAKFVIGFGKCRKYSNLPSEKGGKNNSMPKKS